MFKLISAFINTFSKRISPGRYSIKGASVGLITGSIIFFLFFLTDSLIFTKDYKLIIVFILLGASAIVSAYLTSFIIKKLNSIPRNYKISFLISLVIISSAFSVYSYKYILISIFIIICFSFIGGATYTLLKAKAIKLSGYKKFISVFFLISGISGLVLGINFYQKPGIDYKFTIFPDFKKNKNVEYISAANPSLKGSFSVKTLSYGSGEDKQREEFGKEVDIITHTVNGKSFVSNRNGIGGRLRTSYWGFDVEELPLNARVWYPEGEGVFPLVLMVHGNHLMHDYSDTGYAYLGELLASKGYIFASVDENFLNSSWSDMFGKLKKENDCRAWLLLEHLKLWHRLNKDSASIFFNKTDTENIALIGHSRGGEAVAHAVCFNKLKYYPDNASERFNYNFNIRSIVAIAPTDGQYKPTNIKTTIKNIDYFVIHGANDGDVKSFSGANQYERVHFTDSLYHFKSGLYIYGANHGQFNTSWGKYDKSGLSRKFLNLSQLMPGEEQRQIAKVYITAFLDLTLKNKKEYLPLFLNSEYGRKWLPETVYINQFEDSNCEFICTFDEDIDITTTTTGEGVINTYNLTLWKEKLVRLKQGTKQSKVACIRWNQNKRRYTAKYEIIINPEEIKVDTLSSLIFSLAADKIGKTDGLIDFTIQLTDKSGEKLTFLLSDYSFLHPPLRSKLMKLSFLNKKNEADNVFQTYIFPLKKKSENNDKFNIKEIYRIRFIFDKTIKGRILIDNIGFIKYAGNG